MLLLRFWFFLVHREQQIRRKMTHELFYESGNNADAQTRNTALLLKKAKNVDWVDAVVQAATICNQLFQRRACNLCHVYVDRQIEFEQRQETTKCGDAPQGVVTPVERLWMQMDTGVEVELYRQFLFDEASVVNHVSEDDERDDDEDGPIQFRPEDEQEPPTSSSFMSVETTSITSQNLDETQNQATEANQLHDMPHVVPV